MLCCGHSYEKKHWKAKTSTDTQAEKKKVAENSQGFAKVMLRGCAPQRLHSNYFRVYFFRALLRALVSDSEIEAELPPVVLPPRLPRLLVWARVDVRECFELEALPGPPLLPLEVAWAVASLVSWRPASRSFWTSPVAWK